MNYSANGIIAVGAPGSDARKSENLKGFMKVYKEELIRCHNNQEYYWPLSEIDNVAMRMELAFIKKSFNKEGNAIKATCKRLGIKYTYKEMYQFFGGY